MSSAGKQSPSVNNGIIGNVQADTAAVGNCAKATGNYSSADHGALNQAIEALRVAIARAELAPPAQKAATRDLGDLQSAASSAVPNKPKAESALKSLLGRFETLGTAVHDVAGLLESVEKIGNLLHIPLQALLGSWAG